jgi:uncharacterized protein YjbI with pentapeptide repeats
LAKVLIIGWVVLVIILISIGVVSFWALQPTKAPTWTGFGPYNETINGPRAKTLWDWFELLIIPAFLAGDAWWLDRSQKRTEKNVETDRQQQKSLESYFDCMTELITKDQLRNTKNEEIHSIARTRTLAILRTLDSGRKVQVLQFLYEAGLINKNPIISLQGADFQRANLDYATLRGAELRGTYFNNVSIRDANLCDTVLSGTDFSGANLSGSIIKNSDLSMTIFKKSNLTKTNLVGSNLTWIDLSDANLTAAQINDNQLIRVISVNNAIMPDGKKHKKDRVSQHKVV